MNKKQPLIRFPIGTLETRTLKALSHCSFAVGSFDKRFTNSLQGATELTEAQRELLHKLAYRYRRQLGITDSEAERLVKNMKKEIDNCVLHPATVRAIENLL